MSKISIEIRKRSAERATGDPVKLSPRDIRSLYFIREPYVDQIVDAAAMLDEGERKLAVRLLQTLLEHRRSSLS